MQLVYTCVAADLRGELDALDAAYDRLSREIQDLNSRAHRIDRQAQEVHYETGHQLVLSDTNRGRERAKRTEQQAAAMHREVTKLKSKLTGLDKQRKTNVFRIVLSHSRKAYSEAMFTQTTEDFFRRLENTFAHFRGAPKTLVIDNLKGAVVHPDWFDPELMPKVQSFCRHYGTVILPTRPYAPRHKGSLIVRMGIWQHDYHPARTAAALLASGHYNTTTVSSTSSSPNSKTSPIPAPASAERREISAEYDNSFATQPLVLKCAALRFETPAKAFQ